MSSDYLFVYGTLMRNPSQSMYHLIARYSDFIGDGYVYGRLYEVDGYPGLKICNSCKDKVYGEVYMLRDPDYVFEVLDDYEECSHKYPEPHEYRRIQTNVHLLDGRELIAWVYEYNYPIKGLKRITSGNYMEYVSSSSGEE